MTSETKEVEPVNWTRAFLLAAKWFFMTTALEAALMLVAFGGHALCRIYIVGDRSPLPLLLYFVVGAWITVGGHFISLIAASITHRSYKIALLYMGLPIFLAVAAWLNVAAGLGSMMA